MRLTRMIEAGGISEGGGATAAEEMDGADSGGRIRQRVQLVKVVEEHPLKTLETKFSD